MTITLRVWILGLTLFVPEEDRLYALMPVTGSTQFGGVPDHHLWVFIPQTQTGPAQFDGSQVLLPGGESNPGALLTQLKKQFADLYEVTQEPISNDLLNQDDPRLRGRVLMPAGRLDLTKCGNLFLWRHRVARPFPYITMLEISKVAVNSVIQISPLAGQPVQTIPLTTPGTIDVGIAYTPHDPFVGGHMPMPDPARGALSPHFIALYGLYYAPDHALAPCFDRKLSAAPQSLAMFAINNNAAGDPFTCVHAFASQ